LITKRPEGISKLRAPENPEKNGVETEWSYQSPKYPSERVNYWPHALKI
jgi:hypothetical protein